MGINNGFYIQPSVVHRQGYYGKTHGINHHSDEIVLSVDLDYKKVLFRTLIKDIHFQVRRGEMVGIYATAGTGKSVLRNCISGKSENMKGTIMFKGLDLYKNLNSLRHLIGEVIADNILRDNWTVKDEFMNAANLYAICVDRKERIELINKTIKLLKLESVANRQIFKLSSGEKKRANIGTELIAYRELLIFDEPEAGLDEKTKQVVFDAFREVVKEGKSLIIISHDLARIGDYDHILVLQKKDGVGTQKFFGTPSELSYRYGVSLEGCSKELQDVIYGERED